MRNLRGIELLLYLAGTATVVICLLLLPGIASGNYLKVGGGVAGAICWLAVLYRNIRHGNWR